VIQGHRKKVIEGQRRTRKVSPSYFLLDFGQLGCTQTHYHHILLCWVLRHVMDCFALFSVLVLFMFCVSALLCIYFFLKVLLYGTKLTLINGLYGLCFLLMGIVIPYYSLLLYQVGVIGIKKIATEQHNSITCLIGIVQDTGRSVFLFVGFVAMRYSGQCL